VRAMDTIARMGGDEFLLLVNGEMAGTDEALRAYAARIRQSLMDPISVGGHSLSVDASVGVAAFPRHGLDAQALLREADLAMYRAKREKMTGIELATLLPPGEDAA